MTRLDDYKYNINAVVEQIFSYLEDLEKRIESLENKK